MRRNNDESTPTDGACRPEGPRQRFLLRLPLGDRAAFDGHDGERLEPQRQAPDESEPATDAGACGATEQRLPLGTTLMRFPCVTGPTRSVAVVAAGAELKPYSTR